MKAKIYPTTQIDAALWEQFMNEIAHRKGIRRGVIQESLEEAIAWWIENGKRNP
jgi:hypothetical protein